VIDHNILYQCNTQRERKQPQSHKEMRREKIYVCANVRHSRTTISRKERKEKYVLYVDGSAFFLRVYKRSTMKQYRENKISFKIYCLHVLRMHLASPSRSNEIRFCYLTDLLFLSFSFSHTKSETHKKKETINESDA